MTYWIVTTALWVILIPLWIMIHRYQRKRDLAIHNRTVEAGKRWINTQKWSEQEKVMLREKGFIVK